MFQRIAVPSSLGSNSPLIGLIELGLLGPEDEGIMNLQSIGNCLPSDTASHPEDLHLQQHRFENLNLGGLGLLIFVSVVKPT
jgi:hypothetical protein